MGELALDGSLLPTFGTLAMSLAGLEANYSTIYTSVENGNTLQAISNLTIYGESSLQDIITVLEEQVTSKSKLNSKQVKIEKSLPNHIHDGQIQVNKNHNTTYDVDFGDVQGQELGKRAMLISAAGHHHCIMIGPPGGGKTMMAERLPTILPPMSWNEMVEVIASKM